MEGLKLPAVHAQVRAFPDIVDVSAFWPEGFRYRGSEIETAVRGVARRALPALVLHEALRMFLQVLFYTLAFAVIPIVLRSPMASRGFSRVFTFYLYASIPPVAAASVYRGLNLRYLDDVFVFVIIFLGYLIVTARSLRKAEASGRHTPA